MAASLFGGSLIDRYDRRRLLLVAQIGQAGASGAAARRRPGRPHAARASSTSAPALVAGFSGLLAGHPLGDDPEPGAARPAAVGAGAQPGDVEHRPDRRARPRRDRGRARSGSRWAYGIDVVSFAGTITAAVLMRPRPPIIEDPDAEVLGSWQRLMEGVRYLKGRKVLQATFIVDLIAMVFGMPRVLFPVLARTQFGGGPGAGRCPVRVGFGRGGASPRSRAAGCTASCVRVAPSSSRSWCGGSRSRRSGSSATASSSRWCCLAVAGGADVVSAVFRSTILQATVPDELRGRMSGIHITVVAGGPRLGDLEGGLVASVFTPTVSVVSGGRDLCRRRARVRGARPGVRALPRRRRDVSIGTCGHELTRPRRCARMAAWRGTRRA